MTSASGHLPARPLIPPPNPSASPRSAAPMPPPCCIMPPKRYLGYSTCFSFSHIANRSRDNVSHTVSSIVLVGARRSSPPTAEVRYDCVFPAERDPMFPVSGARSEVPSMGSSRSSRVAMPKSAMNGQLAASYKQSLPAQSMASLIHRMRQYVYRMAQ